MIWYYIRAYLQAPEDSRVRAFPNLIKMEFHVAAKFPGPASWMNNKTPDEWQQIVKDQLSQSTVELPDNTLVAVYCNSPIGRKPGNFSRELWKGRI